MRTIAGFVLFVFMLAVPAFADPPSGQPVGPHHVGCNVSEILAEHIHTQLTIVDRGTPVPIPANIGIVGTPGMMLCIYWLHTHDASGLIHVEAPMGTFTLADFFAVWGQPLSRTRVGRYTGRVSAKVNGAPYTGAPQSIPLVDGERIVLSVN